jgi:hypothetical protein
MAEHGIAGRMAKALLAQPARLVAVPGIERGGGAADDFLGRVLAHARTLYRHCERSEAIQLC